MPVTHVSEPNGAYSKKQKINLEKTVLQIWSQIIKKIALLAVNEGRLINIFSVSDVLLI